MPAGRPSSFSEAYIKQAEAMSELGLTDIEMASVFGVSVRTLHRWKVENEQFCHALKAGKEIADERVVRSLYQKATGYEYVEQVAMKVKRSQYEEDIVVEDVERHQPADTTAAIFWLKNRRKDEWRDVKAQEHSGPDGDPIQTSLTVSFVKPD